MSKFIAISIEGKVEVHARSSAFNYATLCGIDEEENQEVPLPERPKIDCAACRTLWDGFRAFTVRDFA